MRVSTDDRVWRFQGRLVELDEVEIPMHPRYVAIGIWVVVTPLLMLLLWPTFGFIIGCVGSLIYAAILAWRLADFITGEVTLFSWVGIIRSEFAARRRWRRDRLNGAASKAPISLRPGRGQT